MQPPIPRGHSLFEFFSKSNERIQWVILICFLPVDEYNYLIMMFTSRGYARRSDLELMRQVARTWVRITRQPEYFAPGDIDWMAATSPKPWVLPGLRLFFNPSGELYGFLTLKGSELDIQSHALHRAVETEMLAWTEAHLLSKNDPPGELTAWCSTGDTSRMHLFERSGFVPGARSFVLRALELGNEIPLPGLPEGYRLCSMDRKTHLETRTSAHNTVFNKDLAPLAYRRMTRMPEYRPELDLLVLDPSGECAAFCLARYDGENRAGLIQWLGTHPQQRGKGFARAALAAALNQLGRLGAARALVNCDTEAPAPNRLYTKAGFAELERNQAWHKTLV
jgi:GNAT superfamily N-acetyltransferase